MVLDQVEKFQVSVAFPVCRRVLGTDSTFFRQVSKRRRRHAHQRVCLPVVSVSALHLTRL